MTTANNGRPPRVCEWCNGPISSKKRTNSKFCSDSCRYNSFSCVPCLYCGQPANSRDHVITRRMREVVELRYGPGSPQLHRVPNTVPACKECNCIAGARLFYTISAKRRYIQARLKAKNFRLLNGDTWTDEELDELSGTLRVHVVGLQYQKEIMKSRISYKPGKRTHKLIEPKPKLELATESSYKQLTKVKKVESPLSDTEFSRDIEYAIDDLLNNL